MGLLICTTIMQSGNLEKNERVRTSGIVPLIGSSMFKTSGSEGNQMIPDEKAIVRLENICDQYCKAKYSAMCEKESETTTAIKRQLLALDYKVTIGLTADASRFVRQTQS
jgi:hypothetical protein